MKFKKIELALIAALIICILGNVFVFSASCREIKSDVLRLHIIAHSDATEDQALKLKIRDEILARYGAVFHRVQSLDEAKLVAQKNMSGIVKTANEVIENNGYSYKADAALEKAFFQTRYYDTFTLPAGYYCAVKITVGAGKGHNWWCVMYPTLCLKASGEIREEKRLNEAEKSLLLADPRVEVRFKCVEIYEKVKNYLKII